MAAKTPLVLGATGRPEQVQSGDTFVAAKDVVPSMCRAGLLNASLAVTPNTATITVTIASPAVVTWTNHGLIAGMSVIFTTTGALPTGITAGTVYFVISAGLTSSAFQFSTTVGGSAVNTSGSQSGTHTGSAGMTVALKTYAGTDPAAADPVIGLFRSPTAATGTLVSRTATAATSLRLSAGSAIGLTTGSPVIIWVVIFDDNGTMRLGLITCSGPVIPGYIRNLHENELVSSSAEGGIGGADTGFVFYTGTAVTSKAYLIVGYLQWDSVGTFFRWSSAPDRIQLYGSGTPLPGVMVQRSPMIPISTMATGTTVIPADDTIPQNTEGDQYMTQPITPLAKANHLRIVVDAALYAAAGQALAMALFQDSNASAIKSLFENLPGAMTAPYHLEHWMQAGITAETTFKMRAGGHTAGTTTFNGFAGARYYGGAVTSMIYIED